MTDLKLTLIVMGVIIAFGISAEILSALYYLKTHSG
jgi:hypothetical protein